MIELYLPVVRSLRFHWSLLSPSEPWFNIEILPDSVLLSSAPGAADRSFSACRAGSTCLASELVTLHMGGFPRSIAPSDHLGYPDTAGYQVDSDESSFHDTALVLKVVLHLDDVFAYDGDMAGTDAAPGRPRAALATAAGRGEKVGLW